MIDILITLLFSESRVTNAIAYAVFGGIGGALGVCIAELYKKFTKKDGAKFFVIIFAIIAFQVGPVSIRQWLSNTYPLKIKLHENQITADLLNKNTPQRLDEITVLSRVEGTERGVNYIYSLDLKFSDIEDIGLFMSTMGDGIVAGACSEDSVRAFLNEGRAMEYSYYDIENKFIASIEMVASKCNIAPLDKSKPGFKYLGTE